MKDVVGVQCFCPRMGLVLVVVMPVAGILNLKVTCS